MNKFVQSNYKGIGCGLNDDTLGGIFVHDQCIIYIAVLILMLNYCMLISGVIKGGISQFIALEISRGNSRENRAIGRHLPWLYNAPSAIQQGYSQISKYYT